MKRFGAYTPYVEMDPRRIPALTGRGYGDADPSAPSLVAGRRGIFIVVPE